MTTLLLVVVAAALAFGIAFISPLTGTHLQQKSKRAEHATDRKAGGLPPIIQRMVQASNNALHRALRKSAHGGKKSHQKLFK